MNPATRIRLAFLSATVGVLWVLQAPSPMNQWGIMEAVAWGGTPDPTDPKNDTKPLAGTWTAVSYSGDCEAGAVGQGGYLPSADALKTGRLLLRSNDWSREEFHEGNVTIQNSFTTYRVDPTKEPPAIDFVLIDPYDRNEILFPGIYELKGNTLRICRTVKPNGPRPTTFEAEKGSGKVLAVWRRDGRADAAERRPEYFVRKVAGWSRPERPGDLGPLLRIKQLEGYVELNSGFTNMSLVVDAYKEGKPVELPDSHVSLRGASLDTSGKIRYAAQVVDLDFLPLADGKKGHCRLRLTFFLPEGAKVSVERDIPKDVIDLSRSSDFAFTEVASTNQEVPLLWSRTGRKTALQAKTKDDVIKEHQEGAILLLTLRFNDPKLTKSQ